MGQSDFSGSWRLDRSRSKIIDTTIPDVATFRAIQTPASLTLRSGLEEAGSTLLATYPLDGKSVKYRSGDQEMNSATKWEGSALLVNTIVNAPQIYSIEERWSRSKDGKSITITRNVVRQTGETESTFVYIDAVAALAPPPAPTLITRPAPSAPAPSPPSAPAQNAESDYVVAAGTHILLKLKNPVNTKYAAVGARIYLETSVPVFVNKRLVIPVGSYVTGTVTETNRAGKVKGKSELALEYDSLTLANGIARDLHARPDSVGSRGNLDKTEGKIVGESNKVGDAGKVARTTTVGTGLGTAVGAAAGHVGAGAGLGAAGGALAGLASVFGSRGSDVVLPAGTMMDMVVDHDLRYSDEDLRNKVQ